MSNCAAIYDGWGITPVINAKGNKTSLGSSTPSAEVRRAMEEANSFYCDMGELMDRAGDRIADVLGVDCALVTSGCASAMVHAAAAVMTEGKHERAEQLPDTSGMRNEFVFQKRHSYFYLRGYSVAGGKMVLVGDERSCTSAELIDAISPKTAAITCLEKLNLPYDDSSVSFDQLMEIAGEHSLPVILDAAHVCYPLAKFRSDAQSADLVCFSGKCFGAPGSTGFLCGKEELVLAARCNSIAAAHSEGRIRNLGRPMKIDRQHILGLVVALESWFEIDHDKRFQEYRDKAKVIEDALLGLEEVTTEVIEIANHEGVRMKISVRDGCRVDLECVSKRLLQGSPSIVLNSSRKRELIISLHTLLA